MRITKNTKTTRITIDRFEGNFAICETEGNQMIDIPASIFPSGASEGNIYEVGFTELKPEEEEHRKRINEKVNKLWLD